MNLPDPFLQSTMVSLYRDTSVNYVWLKFNQNRQFQYDFPAKLRELLDRSIITKKYIEEAEWSFGEASEVIVGATVSGSVALITRVESNQLTNIVRRSLQKITDTDFGRKKKDQAIALLKAHALASHKVLHRSIDHEPFQQLFNHNQGPATLASVKKQTLIYGGTAPSYVVGSRNSRYVPAVLGSGEPPEGVTTNYKILPAHFRRFNYVSQSEADS